MSRIGRKPIIVPAGVTVTVADSSVSVMGPKGSLNVALPVSARVEIIDNVIRVTSALKDKVARARYGLTQRLIENAVIGCSEGFEKRLEIKGVGMRAIFEEDRLILSLGFSHSVEFKPPTGVEIGMEKNVVVVRGNDKQQVGDVAARIRALRPVEPYKGKGIRYLGEKVLLKPGKTVKSAGTGAR